MPTLDLGILVSGTGTNMQAVLRAIDSGQLDARVRLVVSNKANVRALDRAASAGIPSRVISHKDFACREDFDRALVAALQGAGVQWIVLAGFMRILTPVFLDHFPLRVLNIHPALLPAFPGVDAQAQALEYGVRVTGCTVHFVDNGTDTGPIIAQSVVPISDDDTRDTLAQRLLAREHECLVTVLQWIAEGRVSAVAQPGKARPKITVEGRRPLLGVAEGR